MDQLVSKAELQIASLRRDGAISGEDERRLLEQLKTDSDGFVVEAAGVSDPGGRRAIAIWMLRVKLLSMLWDSKSRMSVGQLRPALRSVENLSRLADSIWRPGRHKGTELSEPFDESNGFSYYVAGYRIREIAFLSGHRQTDVLSALNDAGFSQPWRTWSIQDDEELQKTEFADKTIRECSQELRRSPWDVAYRFCENSQPGSRNQVKRPVELERLGQNNLSEDSIRESYLALDQLGVLRSTQDEIVQQARKSVEVARELGIMNASIQTMRTASGPEQRRAAAVAVCALDRMAVYVMTFGMAVGGIASDNSVRSQLKDLVKRLAESWRLYSPSEVKFFQISEIWENVTQLQVPYTWLADEQINLVQLAAFEDRDLRRELGKLRHVADVSWTLWLRSLRSSETVRQPSHGKRAMTQTSVDSPTDLLRNADVVTHPSAIIDIYESVTGVQWSPTQRRRAASGEHVLRLIMFSQTELLQAAEAQRDAAIFDWTRWRNDAIAVRNRDIKFD